MNEVLKELKEQRDRLQEQVMELLHNHLLPEVEAKIASLVANKRAILFDGLTCFNEVSTSYCEDKNLTYETSRAVWSDPHKAAQNERELREYEYSLRLKAEEIMREANKPRIDALDKRIEELNLLIEQASADELASFKTSAGECPAELVEVVNLLNDLPSFELALMRGEEKNLMLRCMPWLKDAHIKFMGGHKKK